MRRAMRALDLPETEAPHLGVSSGGGDVDGGFAKVARNGSPSSGRQLRRGGCGWWVCQVAVNYSSEVLPPSRKKKARIEEKTRREKKQIEKLDRIEENIIG